MATPDTIVDSALTATKSATIVEHIVERRIEYLVGTLIAHQMGFLDALLIYGSGVCG